MDHRPGTVMNGDHAGDAGSAERMPVVPMHIPLQNGHTAGSHVAHHTGDLDDDSAWESENEDYLSDTALRQRFESFLKTTSSSKLAPQSSSAASQPPIAAFSKPHALFDTPQQASATQPPSLPASGELNHALASAPVTISTRVATFDASVITPSPDGPVKPAAENPSTGSLGMSLMAPSPEEPVEPSRRASLMATLRAKVLEDPDKLARAQNNASEALTFMQKLVAASKPPPKNWDPNAPVPPLSIPNTPRSPPPARPSSPDSGEPPAFGLVGGEPWVPKPLVIPPPPEEKEDDQAEQYRVKPRSLDLAVERSLVIRPYFNGFARDNPLRLRLHKTFESESTQLFLSSVNLACCLYLVLAPEMRIALPRNGATRSVVAGHSSEWDKPRSVGLDIFDYVCMLCLALEVFAGSLVYGFNGETGWINHSLWNWMDLLLICAEMVEFASSYTVLIGITFRPLRIFRLLQNLLKVKALSELKVILATLWGSVTQLVIVVAILGLFLITFAIFGMAIFQRSFDRVCVSSENYIPSCASSNFEPTCDLLGFGKSATTHGLASVLSYQAGGNMVMGASGLKMVSGGYPFHQSCKIFETDSASTGIFFQKDKYPQDRYGRSHNCQLSEFVAGRQVTSMCQEETRLGSDRFAHFNHIGGAILVILQCAIPNGFYGVLHKGLESEPSAYYLTWILFVSVTCLCTWLMIGIFVAVVTDTYRREWVKFNASRNPPVAEEVVDDDGLLPLERVQKEEKERVEKAELAKKALEEAKRRRVLAPHRKDPVIDELLDLEDLINQKPTQTAKETITIIVKSSGWANFISLMVTIHCVAIYFSNWAATPQEKLLSKVARVMAILTFCVEIIFRIIAEGGIGAALALGGLEFDFVVIVCGLFGLIFEEHVFLVVLPAVRLYRLMRYFPTLNQLLRSAIKSASSLMNLIIFMIFVGLAVSSTGRYMFGGDMDSISRTNFGSLSVAVLTTFQLLTGDSWALVMYDSLNGLSELGMHRQVLGVLFIITWFLFSSFILKNIFIAVIIQNFEVGTTIKNISQPGRMQAMRDSVKDAWYRYIITSYALRNGDIRLDVMTGRYLLPSGQEFKPEVSIKLQRDESAALPGVEQEEASKRVNADRNLTDQSEKGAWNNDWDRYLGQSKLDSFDPASARGSARKSGRGPISKLKDSINRFSPRNPRKSRVGPEPSNKSTARSKAWDAVISSAVVQKQTRMELYTERSLFLFRPTNPTRLLCIFIAENFVFQGLIIGVILLNCFMMFVTPPYPDLTDDPPLVPDDIAIMIDYISTVLFTVEFIVNVVSLGLIQTSFAYLKSGWNCLDTLVLVFSWFDVVSTLTKEQGGNYSLGKVFRLLRTLRPLRLMKRNEGMRVVIDALMATLAPVFYVVIFSAVTFVVFGLIGMGLFGGKLDYCSTPGAEYPAGIAECSGSHVMDDSGIMLPRAWIKPPHNFDTSWSSVITLYRMNTVKYVAILQDAVDITNYNQSPDFQHSNYLSLFFVVYMIIGSLFVMNLFVGFIVDGFNLRKGTTAKDIIFNRFSRQFRDHRPRKKSLSFLAPNNFMSSFISDMLNGMRFQIFSAACVFINVGFMLADHVNPSESFTRVMDAQNLIFFLELVFELVLNVLAYGPGVLIDDRWKQFDLFVAGGTMIGYLVSSPQITQFVKAFRLLRVVRLMVIVKKIHIILETLIKCLPQLANIIVLLLLVYSMFSVIGMTLFSSTKYGLRLGPTANFGTWGSTMMTAYQMVTGDEWMDIMDDCSVVVPSCTPQFDNNLYPEYGYQGKRKSFGDCGTPYAPLYFIAFKLIGEAIMLNLFIGMIIENFSFITDDVAHAEEDDWGNGASADQIIEIVEIFTALGLGTDMIRLVHLPKVIAAIPQPLGMRNRNTGLVMDQGEQDRVQLKFVRAELNVIVKEARDKEEEMSRGSLWGWYVYLRTCGQKRKYEAAISFEQLMNTLVYWRLPKLVPQVRKLARHGRVTDVIFMTHCLVLKDVLQVYRRKAIMARKEAGNKGGLVAGGTFADDMVNKNLKMVSQANNKVWAADRKDMEFKMRSDADVQNAVETHAQKGRANIVNSGTGRSSSKDQYSSAKSHESVSLEDGGAKKQTLVQDGGVKNQTLGDSRSR